jgi:hypothetical protein
MLCSKIEMERDSRWHKFQLRAQKSYTNHSIYEKHKQCVLFHTWIADLSHPIDSVVNPWSSCTHEPSATNLWLPAHEKPSTNKLAPPSRVGCSPPTKSPPTCALPLSTDEPTAARSPAPRSKPSRPLPPRGRPIRAPAWLALRRGGRYPPARPRAPPEQQQPHRLEIRRGNHRRAAGKPR